MKNLKDYDLKLPDGGVQTLSFSITFIENLQILTEKDIATWSKDLALMDEISKGLAVCDVVHSAWKAHDLEEDIEDTPNIYKIRKLVSELDEESIGGLVAHLFSTLSDEKPGKSTTKPKKKRK